MAWVLDLDGVIWLAHQPIAGSVEAVQALDGAGEDVVFVTNFSALTKSDAESKLGAIGIDATDRVITSAMAGASLVGPGERVLVCAGDGVWEAVEARGAEPLDPSDGIGVHADVAMSDPHVVAEPLRREHLEPHVAGQLPGQGRHALVRAVLNHRARPRASAKKSGWRRDRRPG